MFMESPVGLLKIVDDNQAITEIGFCEEKTEETYSDLSSLCILQLQEYFAGKRKVFTLPLAPLGTPFQRRVWEALCQIPYGETKCYQEIAIMVGNEKASRAVGLANNKNPISIVIPCHRVIGKNGSLVGYGGGLNNKTTLLILEQSFK